MRVFLSYSSSNHPAVLPLVQDLIALGQDVPFARKTVGAPVRWRRIASDIQASDLFVSALTSQSLISYTCQLELNYATRLGKRVLPVLLADIDFEKLPPQLAGVPIADYRKQDGEARAELAAAIQNVPQTNPLPPDHTANLNWMASLEELGERIDNIDANFDEQAAILFNLREFAERQETLEPAAGLLEVLAAHELSLYPRTAKQIERTLSDINYVRGRRRKRRTALAGAVASFAVAIPFFLLNAAPGLGADADDGVTPAFVVQNVEATEELLSPTPTETQTATPTLSRTPTDTPTRTTTNTATATRTSTRRTPSPSPSQRPTTAIPAQVQATNMPPTSVPPTAVPPTNVPPTAVPPTSVPPTSIPPTAVPPTNVPPTAVPPTSVPPTSVPPTAVPPTAVPPTSVPPTNPPPTNPPPTAVPPLLPPIDLPLPTIDLPLLPPINLGNGNQGEGNNGNGNGNSGNNNDHSGNNNGNGNGNGGDNGNHGNGNDGNGNGEQGNGHNGGGNDNGGHDD